MANLSDNIGQALTLLAAADKKLENQLFDEAVILFCKAYALQPGLVKDQMSRLPRHKLNIVFNTLEDWCVCASDSVNFSQRTGIALSLDQICNLITSPGFRPESRVAWSARLRLQMQRKSYLDVVTSCSEALKIFSYLKDEILLLLQRSVAYLLLNERKHAIKDLITSFEKDFEASVTCAKETQGQFIPVILEALYQTAAKFTRQAHSFSDEERKLLVKLDRVIVGLNPKDSATLRECADQMFKLKQFKKAVSVLSDGINQVGISTESLQLLLQRAHSYLSLEETELALNDYVTTLSIDDEIARITVLLLPQQQQEKIASSAKRLASELLTHCRIKTRLQTACSVDTRITAQSLNKAALLYRLLYLLDGNNVDALLNSAECLTLQGKEREAIQVLDLAHSLRPKYSKAHYARAFCYMKIGDMSSALADFNKTLEIQPSFVQALCGCAFVCIMRGKAENAATYFSSACAISTAASVSWILDLPDREQENLKVQLNKYLVSTVRKPHQGQQPLENASLIRLGDLLTRAFATDVECHLVFVDVLQSLCKMDEAQAILVRLIRHNPDDNLARLHLAAFKIRRGGSVDALEEICTLLKTVGEGTLACLLLRLGEDDRERISREGYCEGVQRFNASPSDTSAEQYFTVSITASPDRAFNSYLWRAKIEFQKGELDAALTDYNKVLEKKPNCLEALCGRGLLYATKNRLRESYQDLLQASLLNLPALETFILSRTENNKHLLMGTLEDCAQMLFSHYLSRGFRSKCIIKLCHLLVQTDSESASYHSMYADGLIIFEDYRRAAEELDIAERLCPNDTSVLSRSGLVRMKLNQVQSAVVQFKRVAESDTEALQFAVKALNLSQKRSLSQEALARAEELTDSCQNEHALGYLTLALVATEGKKQETLRMRSKCFERLELFPQAIEDMTSVIAFGPPLASDICARAKLHLLVDDNVSACFDFIVAMDTHEIATLDLISSCPGKDTLIKVFVTVATSTMNCKKFSDGLMICNYGLRIDPGNPELRNLKRRFELGASNKCVIQ